MIQSPARLSILAMLSADPDLFADFALPEQMEKDTLIDYIIQECAELEILITRPAMLKRMITSWSRARLHSWERLYQSTIQQYNMIHNYDRYEEWRDERDISRDSNGRSTRTPNLTGKVSHSEAAYNTQTLKPISEDNTEQRGTETATADVLEDTSDDSSHSGHLYGNIGVTTAAQMLEGERELNTYDVYLAIANEFKRRFCVIVY